MRTLVVYIMNSLLLCLIIAVGIIQFSRSSNLNLDSSTITIDIPNQGLIQGNYDTTLWSHQLFMSFRGIPFAESPRGPLRFKASTYILIM